MATVITPAATLIADRGGATPGYANDPAKLLPCNKWLDHARPIITAMFVLDDQADWPLLEAVVDAGKGLRFGERDTWQVRDYRDARDEIKGARIALFNMLDGIRDNFISDERVGCYDDDEQDEADDFNDWLDVSTITVDQAIAIVTDEHNTVFYGRKVA